MDNMGKFRAQDLNLHYAVLSHGKFSFLALRGQIWTLAQDLNLRGSAGKFKLLRRFKSCLQGQVSRKRRD